MKNVIDKEVKLIEVSPAENFNNNTLEIGFLEISPVQMEVPPSHKLQGHACESHNLFGFKEDNPS